MKQNRGETPVWVGALLAVAVFVLPQAAVAVVPERYTNDNFQQATHEAPATFSQDAAGNFRGYTVSGRLFSQINIANAYGIRLQRFAIDDAYFYISDRGVIFASTDIAAVSVYLSRAT